MRAAAARIGLLLAHPAASLPAQAPPLQPGTRVQVHYACRPGAAGVWTRALRCARLRGTLAALTAQSIAVDAESGGGRVQIGLTSVSRLQRVHGQKSKIVTGMALGFAGGALLGTLALSATAQETPITAGGAVVYGALVGGVPGALVGAGIGGFVRVDRWEDVPPSAWRRAGAGAGAAPQRALVGVAVAF